MKNCCSWLPETIGIVGVAIGVGVAFQGWPVWPDVQGQTWAAWVQAVGSVGAIIGSIWIGRKQSTAAHESALRVLQNEQDSRRASYDEVFRVLYDQVDSLRSDFDEEDAWGFAEIWEDYGRSKFDLTINAAKAIPVHDLGASWRVSFALMLISSCQAVRTYSEEFSQKIDSDNADDLARMAKLGGLLKGKFQEVGEAWDGLTNFGKIS